MAASATWTSAWRVSPTGEFLIEYLVSRTPDSVTVRDPPEHARKKGGTRYQPHGFDRAFGATRAEAVEKFLEQQRGRLTQAQHELAQAQLLIERGDALRRAEAP